MMTSNETVPNEEEALGSEAMEENEVVGAPQALHTPSQNMNASMMPSSANIGHNLIERED